MNKFSLVSLCLLCMTSVSYADQGIVSKIQKNLQKAKVSRACSDLKTINSLLDLHMAMHNKYPTEEEGLNELVQKKMVKKKYLLDSWGTPYLYKISDTTVSLTSLGADKKVGGADLNADITLESCNAEQ